ncbi:MAG: hypothetical protein CW691_04635 [Candidatus Bathyarchaeum sp.]|nr:MAG: hypothetical protein CW691_04635 [Candidatus Bathyarchaeum sp.]
MKVAEEKTHSVREDYVQKMRDNYLLIMFTIMHDLVVSIDKDGKLTFVNDATTKFFGKSRKKILGTHFTKFLDTKDVKKAVFTLEKLIENKDHVEGFVLKVKSPKGLRTVAWNGVAIFDEKGNYVGAQAIGKDLTDVMRVEEELEQSKHQFQRLFEVIVDPIVIVDLEGKILDFSQSAEEGLGFTRRELVGKHILETNVVTNATKEIMEKNLEKIKKGKYIKPQIVEAVTKDGRKLLYEVIPARLEYKGNPAILAIFRNITEKRRAEEKLQASEERFKYFLDNAPEAIWVQDPMGTFIDGNKKAEEITGYKREELIGKNILDINFVPLKYVAKVIEAFQINQRGERSGPTELELIKKDGSLVHIEASSIPVDRDGKIEIIGIARDISNRKRAEVAVQESENRFRELGELLPETFLETLGSAI